MTTINLKHFVMNYTFLYTFWSLKCSVSFITYRSVLSASSSGGISSSSSHGQSAPPFLPFCSPIKSGREFGMNGIGLLQLILQVNLLQ